MPSLGLPLKPGGAASATSAAFAVEKNGRLSNKEQ